MWTVLLGPLLALLPKPWRESMPFSRYVQWGWAAILSGFAELAGAIVALSYWYIYAMSAWVDRGLDSALSGKMGPNVTTHQIAGVALSVWATLYDGVGSVKGHVEFASRWRLVLSSPRRIFSLSFISTKARFVNPAVETGSTNHLFGLPLRGTMIRSSDAAITRGSKAPNQPSDELAFIRVAPGLPCLRTSRA